MKISFDLFFLLLYNRIFLFGRCSTKGPGLWKEPHSSALTTRPKLKGLNVRLDLKKSCYDILTEANDHVKRFNHLYSFSMLVCYMPNGNLFEFFLFKVMIIDSKVDKYNLTNLPIRKTRKKGGVCIYYKEYIPPLTHSDIWTLENCWVTEICSHNEKCSFTCVYCSLNQNYDEFQDFCINSDAFLNHINDKRFYYLSCHI